MPPPGNPQRLNRYTYANNHPLKYIDPSGHEGCEAGDEACWQRRWYLSHGYQYRNGQWVQTGYYEFIDPEALHQLLLEVTLGKHQLPAGWSFHFNWGSFRVSVEPRGQDTQASNVLGAFGVIGDMLDFTATSAFAIFWTVAQIMGLAGGPSVLATLGGGEVAYRMVQQGLLWVDVLGLFANVLADVSAGRSSLSLEGGTLSIGLDTLASSWTLAMSNTPLPSVPGVYWNMFWDAMQLYYDAARMSGGLPGYGLVVQWK